MTRTSRYLLVGVLGLGTYAAASPVKAQEPPPQTGFEQRNGASWTTHDEELAFLAEVDARTERMSMEVIGETALGRPLHLVRVGNPAPHSLEASLAQPTTLFVCSQHGNEPAGREACLKTIRDLAFTTDPTLIQQLSTQTFLFVPTANPDGRAANTRGNSRGTDINRDHLTLRTEEAAAIAAVVRDWKPDLSIDLHEYGPSIPVLYDDEILYLWPRNLNVEKGIHDMARSFALDKIEPCAEQAGYTADEYGIYAAGDVDVTQTAGDQDEGIMRNTMGLRHSLGILIETAVTQDPRNNAGEELIDSAANNRRRVASHRHVVGCSLSYMLEKGAEVASVTATAPLRKWGEGLAQNFPVYFGGADNDPPTAAETVYPPPCGYDMSADEAAQAQAALELHGIRTVELEDGRVRIPLGQEAEPIIPLLVDGRGARNLISADAYSAPPFDPSCGTVPPSSAAATGTAAGLVLVAGLSALAARRSRRDGTRVPEA